MVSKKISPESQRVTIVEITEKGKKALEIIQKHRSDRFKSLLEAIRVSDKEKEILINVCVRAVKFMDEHFGFSNMSNKAKINSQIRT